MQGDSRGGSWPDFQPVVVSMSFEYYLKLTNTVLSFAESTMEARRSSRRCKDASISQPEGEVIFGSQAFELLANSNPRRAMEVVFVADVAAGWTYGVTTQICQDVNIVEVLSEPSFPTVLKFMRNLWQKGMQGAEVYTDPTKGFGLKIANQE